MRLNATDLLFTTALEETAGLGVEVLVAAMKYVSLPRAQSLITGQSYRSTAQFIAA
jgi:hypothetical protein